MSSGRFEIPTQLGEPAHAGLFAEYASELLLKSSAFALTGEAEFLGEDISLNQVANTLDSSPVVLASSETSVAGASSAALATSAASAEDVCATPSPVIENETVVEPGCAGFIQASREWAQDAIQNGAGPDTYPEGSIPDRLIEAEISGNGSAVATQIAIEQGFYRPEAIKESFNLFAGSRFVMTQEAGMQILNPNGSVAHTLWSPCDGDGAAYTGQRMIDTVPCSDVTPEPEPKAEPVYVAPLVVEPTPEPVVVETKPEPIPEPELEPITDRVRIFQTFAYGCVGGECGLVPTMFLTFDSVEDAHEFFDSAEGKEMLKTLLAGGNNLGNCVYITDGHGTLQQISLVTEDHRVGGRTVRQIVLGPDGAPSLSGELEESRFIERNSSGRERSYTLEEDDFENRYSRGIGEVSEADNTRLPQVKDMRGATPGVGGVQELWLNPETGRWEYVPLENAIAEGDMIFRKNFRMASVNSFCLG